MNKKTKPNFLIVGAAKSGTTSLYHYLKQHNEIFLPEFKEPQFFVSDLVSKKVYKSVSSEEGYSKLFENAADYDLRGEASVFYLYYYKKAIENILHYLGKDTKIIIILRNPIERAFSAYKHVVTSNPSLMMSFEDALMKEEEYIYSTSVTPMTHYKRMGLYFEMVKAYQQAFEHVQVVLYDDLKNNPSEVMRVMCDFLGAEDQGIDVSKRHNAGKHAWKFKWIGNLILKDNVLKRSVKMLPFFSIIKKQILKKSTQRFSPITIDVQRRLVAYYKDDINNLSDLLGTDLSDWMKVK